ncbi:MAG: adenylate kinase [Acidimicrobiia bacterium]
MQRIAVIGTTGSGKTTLAARIAERLGTPHVELDALHWDPAWTPSPAFRERTAGALDGDEWVVDGNYSQVRDIVWSRADTVVWLDYSLWLILGRLLRRTLRRVSRREELWNENRERLRDQLASRDSLFLWALRTYPRRKREYPELLGRPEHAHLKVVRLRSPRHTRAWLADLG